MAPRITTRDRDDIIVFHHGIVDVAREERVETEPWPTFVAGLHARVEERRRAERIAERILGLTLDL